jgi:hypothetical protein
MSFPKSLRRLDPPPGRFTNIRQDGLGSETTRCAQRYLAIPRSVWNTILDEAGMLPIMELLNYDV